MSFFSWVQGWVRIKGDSDGTKIGNVGDRLKTNAEPSDNQKEVFNMMACTLRDIQRLMKTQNEFLAEMLCIEDYDHEAEHDGDFEHM